MTQAQSADFGRTARWLLLFGTLFGLGLMHTLGHLDVAGHAHPHAAVQATTHAAEQPDTRAAEQSEAPDPATAAWWPDHLTTQAVAAPCPDGHCDHTPAHSGMGAWGLCLAVLGGIISVLLAAMLLRGSPFPSYSARDGVGECHVGRAPPTRRAGLTVASTAVLRV